jgi:phospholipid/cholesterol/gamma-HCH transport system substrate-binding protein
VDSSASILTSGLLGEQYVGLEPGGMDEYLKEGANIKLTQSALVLEKIVGHLFTSLASKDKSD